MKRVELLLLIYISICVYSVWGQIQNRSFELPASNEPNASSYFIPALSWEYTNYAGIHSSFIPRSEYRQAIEWTIDSPVDGNSFLVLSTGDLGPNSDSRISQATASQLIYVPAGTTISGNYYFGTCDYLPFLDFGKIELIPVNSDPNTGPILETITLVYICISDVGSYQSTGVWESFSSFIDMQHEGLYNLVLSVSDQGDTIYKSYLAVDNLLMCGPGLTTGDISGDCLVNMADFSLFSKEWLIAYETDPNGRVDPNSVDPNSLCVYADFNKNKIVDTNDLDMMAESWLLSNQ